MPFSIQITGLDDAIRRLQTYPDRVQKQLKGELKLAAEEVRKLAIKDAPGDQGRLRQSITVSDQGGLTNTTTASVPYAAFQEWGTKKYVSVPTELSAYAATFKGKSVGSGGVKLDEAILAWVKRKKIAGTYSVKTQRRTGGKARREQEDKQVAFLIARKIARDGIRAHPFFFKNVFLVRDKLGKRVPDILRKAL
jgi:hypothetical protein